MGRSPQYIDGRRTKRAYTPYLRKMHARSTDGSSVAVGEGVLAIERRDYLLPAIQRDFVWDAGEPKCYSIRCCEDTPVGSFLFWKVLPTENLKTFRFYEFLRHIDASEDVELQVL